MKNLPSRGFTLIEVMVAIALIVIMMFVAIPNLSAYQRNAELTSLANSLLSSMATARSEAMKRNRIAMLIPNAGSDWASGWKIFIDIDRDGTLGSSDIVLGSREAATNYAGTGTGVAAGSSAYVLFNGSGYAKTISNGLGMTTISFSRNGTTGAALITETRRVVVAATGRVRVCKPASATDSTCLATDTNAS